MKCIVKVIWVSLVLLWGSMTCLAEERQLLAACLPVSDIPEWCNELKALALVQPWNDKARDDMRHALVKAITANAGDASRMAVLDRLAIQFHHACLSQDAFQQRQQGLKTNEDVTRAMEAALNLKSFRKRFPTVMTDELKVLEHDGHDIMLQEWADLFVDAEVYEPVDEPFVESKSADGIHFVPMAEAQTDDSHVWRVCMTFTYMPLEEYSDGDTAYLNLAGMPHNAVVYVNGVMQARLPLQHRHSFRIELPDSRHPMKIALCYEYVGDKPAALPLTPWISMSEDNRRDRGR